MSTARVDFTRGAAERIARVVRIVEQGDRDGAPLTFRRVGGEGGKAIRLCSWAATWYESSTALVTFSSGSTATATNVFFGVGPGSGWVAKDAGVWKLVSVRLSGQPGYDGREIQLLGHNSSSCPDGAECSGADRVTTLQWYSIATCATATASP
jgi:hypothetical protein